MSASPLPPAGRLLFAAASLLLLTAAGCGAPRAVSGAPDASSPSTRMSNVALGEVFEVRRGGAVLVDGHRLRFESVVAENRCPLNVDCIRAGEAIAAFTFVGTQSIGEVRLQIPGYATSETEPAPEQAATRGRFRFTLLALDPYPGTDEAEANERPVATLRVERVGG